MLTADQLKRIDSHLRRENWLLNHDLIAELTDHYADAISGKLAQNVSFELAIQDVHRSFGGRKGLLRMEENFQKTQARTNIRVYRRAWGQAFQWPGIVYTLLLWLGCYVLLINFPVARAIAWINEVDFWPWFSLLLLAFSVSGVGLFLLHRRTQKSLFFLSSWSSPLYVIIQSTFFIFYLAIFLPVQRMIEHYPALSAACITLLLLHEWAGLHMAAFVYRNRVA